MPPWRRFSLKYPGHLLRANILLHFAYYITHTKTCTGIHCIFFFGIYFFYLVSLVFKCHAVRWYLISHFEIWNFISEDYKIIDIKRKSLKYVVWYEQHVCLWPWTRAGLLWKKFANLALAFDVSLLLASMSSWANSRIASDLRRHDAYVTGLST